MLAPTTTALRTPLLRRKWTAPTTSRQDCSYESKPFEQPAPCFGQMPRRSNVRTRSPLPASTRARLAQSAWVSPGRPMCTSTTPSSPLPNRRSSSRTPSLARKWRRAYPGPPWPPQPAATKATPRTASLCEHRPMSTTTTFPQLERLMERELGRFRDEHPRSAELSKRAKRSLLGGVPMHWMVRWAGGFPVFAADASGARFRDVDGHEYVDFCLGDTGAMTGHSPPATVRAVKEQVDRGITLMLPSEDALWVGEELARELGEGDVSCVLAEPALTNIGIVLPQPGYHQTLREATRRTGTLLIIDETHTLCAGPGGYTAAC